MTDGISENLRAYGKLVDVVDIHINDMERALNLIELGNDYRGGCRAIQRFEAGVLRNAIDNRQYIPLIELLRQRNISAFEKGLDRFCRKCVSDKGEAGSN